MCDYTTCRLEFQNVCRARWQLAVRDPSFLASYQHLLLMFFPCTFLHLVAFAEQNTDYFSIFINISRGAQAELFGASDVETRIGMFSHASVTEEGGICGAEIFAPFQ